MCMLYSIARSGGKIQTCNRLDTNRPSKKHAGLKDRQGVCRAANAAEEGLDLWAFLNETSGCHTPGCSGRRDIYVCRKPAMMCAQAQGKEKGGGGGVMADLAVLHPSLKDGPSPIAVLLVASLAPEVEPALYGLRPLQALWLPWVHLDVLTWRKDVNLPGQACKDIPGMPHLYLVHCILHVFVWNLNCLLIASCI